MNSLMDGFKKGIGMGSTRSFVGFNQRDIDDSLQQLKRLYKDMDDNSIDLMAHTGKDLSHAWACPDAVKHINNYKSEMKRLLLNAEDELVSIADHIIMAYEKWCATTKTKFNYPGDCTTWFADINTKFNYEPYDNMNGIVGVDATQARLYMDYLKNNYADKFYISLGQVLDIIDKCGFVGGSQQNSLRQSVLNVKTSISVKVDNYVQEFKNLIDKTVQEYEDTAGRIEKTFHELG